MNAQWWEGLAKFICGFWWLILGLVILLLAVILTANLWWPPVSQMLGW